MRTCLLLVITNLVVATATSAQTVLATYDIHDHASGLAYDGRNIWYGRYGTYGERIYKFDALLGQVVDSLNLGAANLDDAYGMTWDGQYLWVTNHVGADFTLKIDTLGNILYSFQNPSDYMSGLAWNGTHLYMGDYYNPDGAIYKVTTTGTIVESFPAPDTQPWDLAWDGATLWMCDYWSDWIYQIDPVTHQVLYSFMTPMTEPAGIAWDGNYLWICDEGQGTSLDHLYKIDPFGAGTPEIQVSPSSLSFGYVPLGFSPVMQVGISNVGDAQLNVTGLPIQPSGGAFFVDPGVVLPIPLQPGFSTSVGIYFSPPNFGAYNGTLLVQSNDPIHPEVSVNLSGFGIYAQQHAAVSTTAIQFGTVWVAQGDALTGRSLAISNLGAPPLNLVSLTSNDPAFFVEGFAAGSLASMDTLEVTVFFMPTQAQTYTGQLTLITDDPVAPVITISLSGTGATAAFNAGDVIWQYHAVEPATFHGFNSVKYMDDINGDGVHEALGADEDYLIYCWNGQSAGTADVFWTFDTGWDPLRTGPVEYQRGMVATPDLNGDQIGDVVIGTGGGSRSVFAVSGANGQQLWSFDTHPFGGDGGWVYEVTCEDDWNGDGVWDVLAAVGGADGATEPKSVFLLSGSNGAQIWRAALGQSVYSVRRLDDLDGDNRAEVVCGTSNNSVTYFVKRLDGQTGAVEWDHPVAGVVFSLNRIEDLNQDGIADVAVGASSGGVYALSGANGTEIWHVPSMGTNYYIQVTGDLNASGYDDILVTSVAGTLYALEGATGSVIWSLPLGSNVLAVAAVPDVTGDGITDACAGIMNGRFVAVSGSNGSILFDYQHGSSSSYAFDAVWWLPDIDHSGAIEFIGGARDGYAYCFSGGDLDHHLTLAVQPLHPPIVIPTGGGSFRYQGSVANTGTSLLTFDYWVMLTLPNGSSYGPIFLRENINLSAGAAISRTLTQVVPPNAPAGEYTYIVRVGDYSLNDIWAEDSFNFTKTGQDAADFGWDRFAAGDWNLAGWAESAGEIITEMPASCSLDAAHPNPFNPTTDIRFQLPADGYVHLTVYDMAGRRVQTLVDGRLRAGLHSVRFDGTGLASGIYLIRLEAGEFQGVRKAVLMK
jgi:outer membrane protein assembly factor BamB